MLNRYFERLSNLDYQTREQQRVMIVAGITLISVVLSLIITWLILLLTGSEMLPIIFIIAAIAPSLIGPITSWHVVNLVIRIQKLEEAQRRQATFDELTGLLSRRAMLAQGQSLLKLCARSQQSFALAMLDLDRFKTVNDRYGHAGGDAVLRTFAGVMQNNLRSSDLVGRLGGEEFAIALPGSSAEDARRILERIRQEVAMTPVLYQEQAIQVTVSIGLVSSPAGQVAEFAALLSKADEALYQAKERGRNCLVG